MTKYSDINDENDAVDNITNVMYAIDFLKSFTETTKDPKQRLLVQLVTQKLLK